MPAARAVVLGPEAPPVIPGLSILEQIPPFPGATDRERRLWGLLADELAGIGSFTYSAQ